MTTTTMTDDLPSILQRGKELAAEVRDVSDWHWVKRPGLMPALVTKIDGSVVYGDRAYVVPNSDEQAAYIVHACNTWPLLAAEIERLRAWAEYARPVIEVAERFVTEHAGDEVEALALYRSQVLAVNRFNKWCAEQGDKP